jgi:pimeloyl-ACP methyl ester carboxylesterase
MMELSHRYRKGNNELILFIHGIGCSRDSFEYVWGLTCFEKYSLLAVDLAGHGDSAKWSDFSYSMEDQAEICRGLLNRFEYDKIHIVAHSMGGAVGLLLAEKLADRLSSFISVEGNLTHKDCGLFSRKTISYPLKEFEKAKFERFIEANEASEERSLRLWAGMLRKCSPLAFYKSAVSLVEWSDSGKLLELFMNLNTRKAYIYGERNSKMDNLDMLNGIDKILISDSGHFVMTDNPDGFYKKLFAVIGGVGYGCIQAKKTGLSYAERC